MSDHRILLLHPGQMGSAIGERLCARGLTVNWVSDGRSQQSIERAAAAGLTDCGKLADAIGQSDIVLSVCPPHNALDLAREVAATGFAGIFVDANAIAPQTSREVGRIVGANGARFTDGGIIGPPPAGSGNARLYLSGPDADQLVELFNAPPLNAIAMDGDIGAASALKMCFAGWNKARIGMLMNLRALAHHHGVEQALFSEWKQTDPDIMRYFDDDKPARSVLASADKAWRWSPEMLEIAATFEQAGLPGGYHRGAADVFERLASFKDSDMPSFAQLAEKLARG